jgi:hypothetical protein
VGRVKEMRERREASAPRALVLWLPTALVCLFPFETPTFTSHWALPFVTNSSAACPYSVN